MAQVGLGLAGNEFCWKMWLVRNFDGGTRWRVRFQSASSPRRLDFTRILGDSQHPVVVPVKHAYGSGSLGAVDSESLEPALLTALSCTFRDLVLTEPMRSPSPVKDAIRLTNFMIYCGSLEESLPNFCFLDVGVDPTAHPLSTVRSNGRGAGGSCLGEKLAGYE